jgi:branched-chain amino acid transport system ATP-binding protein
VLRINELSAGYGSLEILRGVSIEVGDGEFVAVIGPNGAGKSTLLRAIMGSCQIMGGEIALSCGSLSRSTGRVREWGTSRRAAMYGRP